MAKDCLGLRGEIADVLRSVSQEGFPRPRDLDVAIDAILCSFDIVLAQERERAKKFEAVTLSYASPGTSRQGAPRTARDTRNPREIEPLGRYRFCPPVSR